MKDQQPTYYHIEPLCISTDFGEWQHPYVKEHYTPKDGETHDLDVLRARFETLAGKGFTVYFKSAQIMDLICQGLEQGLEDCKKSWLSLIDVQAVVDCLLIHFVEDTWSPAPPHQGFKNSKQYAEFMSQHHTEQFIFTEFGERLYDEYLTKDLNLVFFSPDCGMVVTDGEAAFDS